MRRLGRCHQQGETGEKMKSEKQKKKRGFFGILFRLIGIIILIILIAAAGLSAFILVKMNRDPVETRSIQEYLDSEPDLSFRHLSFNDDGVMTQSYSEEDIGYFLGRYLESEGIDPEALLTEIPVKGIELKGFDLELDPDRTAVCAECTWKKIRIVGRFLADVRSDNGNIVLSLSGIEIAGIRIPVSLIDRCFKTNLAEMSVVYSPEPALIREISDISVGEGKVDITGLMETEFLDYTDLSENRIRVTRLSQERYGYAAATLDTLGDDPAVRFAAIIPVVKADPERYVDYLDQLFTLISATATRKIGIGYKNFGIALRWFPDFDEYDYTDRRSEAYDEYYVCFRFLKTISTKISGDYYAGRLRTSGNGFSYYGDPFSFDDYFGSDYRIYRPFFGMDEGRMCIARREEGSYGNPAMLLRGNDGCGFLVVIYGAEDYSILPLKEEVFLKYLGSDDLPQIVLSDTGQFMPSRF